MTETKDQDFQLRLLSLQLAFNSLDAQHPYDPEVFLAAKKIYEYLKEESS